MSLAYHYLLQDKTRSTLSILGVGLAIMLILVLNGFLTGVDRAASTYLDHAPGSVVVARKDVKNFIYALRNLVQNKIRLVISMGGVALALSLILALDAIMTGVEGRLTAYIDNSGADVFVSTENRQRYGNRLNHYYEPGGIPGWVSGDGTHGVYRDPLPPGRVRHLKSSGRSQPVPVWHRLSAGTLQRGGRICPGTGAHLLALSRRTEPIIHHDAANQWRIIAQGRYRVAGDRRTFRAAPHSAHRRT